MFNGIYLSFTLMYKDELNEQGYPPVLVDIPMNPVEMHDDEMGRTDVGGPRIVFYLRLSNSGAKEWKWRKCFATGERR